MYEITFTVGLRYRGGVRRQLRDLGLDYTEARSLLDSLITIRTDCRELYEILADEIHETAASRALR
jgi:hypothetical protein